MEGSRAMDLTINMTEVELDRPSFLSTAVDCVKWAADGRIAVSLGTVVMIYYPRFGGRQRYAFVAYMAPCPPPDEALLELQRYPGKAGDYMEFARKGFKYIAAKDPSILEKSTVGGDSSTISGIAWSPKGCAWDGGCLLSVMTSLHTVTVFQPPREGRQSMEWEPLATVSKALMVWGLGVCPTKSAARLKLSASPPGEREEDSARDGGPEMGGVGNGADARGGSRGGGAGRGSGVVFDGLWSVARAVRTRSAEWMGRRVVAAGELSRGVQTGSTGNGNTRNGSSGGNLVKDDFTLLALAGERVISLWGFSAGVSTLLPGALTEKSEGLSLGLVSERPAWAGDLRSMGLVEEGDGNLRQLAWCRKETPRADGYRGNGLDSTASSTRAMKDFLAVGTSAGAVLLLEVIISGPSRGGGGGGGNSSAMLSVKALPFRRVCTSDDRPVSMMVFIFPGGGSKGRQKGEQETAAAPDDSAPPALAVAKGTTVSLFPSVFVTATAGELRSAPGSATDSASFAIVEWEAHDHNVTGISTVPFQAPLAADATRASSPPFDNSDAPTDVGRTESGAPLPRAGAIPGAADGRDDSGASAEHTALRRSAAVVYTCSMDGHCKEWEVLIAGGEDEGAPVARLRKSVVGNSQRASPSPKRPPILGCSASPNGVLVASLVFCPAEKTSRKAMEHIARKGKHCRLVLTPMLPAAMARAVSARDSKPGERSLMFTRVRGALATDWAWHLRAASLGNVKVRREGDDDKEPFSLVPALRRALECSISAVARVPGVADSHIHLNGNALSGAEIPVRPWLGTRSSSSSVLWDLLLLHHLVLATQASVTSYKASVRVPEQAGTVGADGDDNFGEDEDDSDLETGGEYDNDVIEGNNASKGVKEGDGVRVDGEAGEGAKKSGGRGGASTTKPRQEEVEVRAAASAAAARSRLVLVRAWEVVAPPRGHSEGSSENQTVTGTTNGGAVARDVWSPSARVAAERCLLYACRLAALRERASLATAIGGKGLLAGPLVEPPLDLPPRLDVDKMVLGGCGVDPSASISRSSEKCPLCRAAMREEGFAEEGQNPGDDKSIEQREGRSAVSPWLRPEASPCLPGWAICLRGHRLRRCMDTLELTLAVSYRRCEVCRCVLEVGPSADSTLPGEVGFGGRAWILGTSVKRVESERERCTCLFCDVLLLSGSGAL